MKNISPFIIKTNIVSFILIIVFFICIKNKKCIYNINKVMDIDKLLSGPLEADSSLLVKFLKSEYLQEPSTQPYNLETSELYIKNMKRSSMAAINKVIHALYSNKQGGFFIEAGALDGQFLSNTLDLEKNHRWTGLLIEADEGNYQDLVKKNRRAWTSPSCISIHTYPEEIIFKSLRKNRDSAIFGLIYRGNSYLMKTPRKSDLESISDVNYYKIQCFPLVTYLLALNISEVDILILDTQGGEDNIIYSFPFDTINITTIVMEHYNQDDLLNKDLIKFMNKNGYIILVIVGEPDYIFIKKSYPLKNFPYKILQTELENKNILTDERLYNELQYRAIL